MCYIFYKLPRKVSLSMPLTNTYFYSKTYTFVSDR